MDKQRDRAWRRFQDYVNNGRGMGSDGFWKPEKKWKFMCGRKHKMARAKQLGFEYPVKSQKQLAEQVFLADE